MLLEENLATDGDFKVGDKVDITGASGDVTLTVRGIYKDDALLGGISMGPVPFDQLAEQKARVERARQGRPGRSVPAVQKRVAQALAAFPGGPRARSRSSRTRTPTRSTSSSASSTRCWP